MLPHILLVCGDFLFLVPCDKLTYKYTIRHLCCFCQGRVSCFMRAMDDMSCGQVPLTETEFPLRCAYCHFHAQSRVRLLHCASGHILHGASRSLEQSCKPPICEKDSNQSKNGVLCTWRLVRKNQFAWKWRRHSPQGWFVLLKLLTSSCRNVPWNRGFSQVEGEKNPHTWLGPGGWRETVPFNANAPPCGREALVDRLPLFIVTGLLWAGRGPRAAFSLMAQHPH